MATPPISLFLALMPHAAWSPDPDLFLPLVRHGLDTPFSTIVRLAPGDHVPHRKILHRKVKRVKLHKTPIVSSEMANG
jgi:hypothetical protein